jgi:holo-[acyl-carrier protein] synthase
MRIIAHGIDLVEVSRIAEMLERHGERFKERVFTAAEMQHAEGKRRESEHLAARFAAKEAVFKALGTGWSGGVAWTDVEVVRLPSGQPSLKVTGRAAEIAAQLGIREWHISITHTDAHAMASVIAAGE